jgi:hypothetical protein
MKVWSPRTNSSRPILTRTRTSASTSSPGAPRLEIGAELIEAPAGSYIVKPRGLPHAFWNPGSTPALVLQITSPVGFGPYYQEMTAVSSPERALAVQAKYGVTFHSDKAAELINRHQLQVGNMWQKWR